MSRNREFANELSDVMRRMADLKTEEKDILQAIKDSGITGKKFKALKKAAKEMIMDSTKLQERFEEEDQLELFRAELQIRARKGLVMEAA